MTRKLVDESDYMDRRADLKNKIINLEQELNDTHARADRWMKTTEQVFDFAANARKNFLDGTPETKKSILMALGQNPTLTNGILEIPPYKWLQPIIDEYPALEQAYRAAEPKKSTVKPERNGDLQTIISSWQDS